jgi:hypothetical protein
LSCSDDFSEMLETFHFLAIDLKLGFVWIYIHISIDVNERVVIFQFK